ncbi:MAG: amidohydrolase [Acidobacteria bacterium]|nr:MAG: amidohydrolase [Acidobacteriota bacterium]
MQRRNLKHLPALALFCALLGLRATAGSPTYAIRDAQVHTLASSGTLPRATVVIADGKIAAVGSNVKIPAGAQIINGQGLEVYPGMINAWSNIGLTEIGSVPATNDASEIGDYNPHLLAFTAIHPDSEHIPVARANGITASLSVPAGGILSGQAVLLHLDGWTVNEMAILERAGLVMQFPSLSERTVSGGGLRETRRQTFSERKRNYERRVREIGDLLEAARHYSRARTSNPSTAVDRKLEALIPVVQEKMAVFIQADTARDIKNAVDFARKEKLKMVLQGGREASRVADLLKKENIPVILESIVALPVREDDPYDARFTLPRDLARAGVRFALTSPSSSDVRNLPYEAGFAQAYGLSHEEALKAVTVNPAEILGVADRMGKIEPGKVADLAVTDGDLLEIRTQVKNLFIAGKNVSLETRHTRLYQKYLNRP